MGLDNEAPEIFGRSVARPILPTDLDDSVEDLIDVREIFDHIKDIRDPEHPLSLEELNVVREEQITISDDGKLITIEFTPTVTRCSMAPLIGISIIVKLMRILPDYMKVDVRIAKGSHDSEEAYNKQLGDKERVAAALENSGVLSVINGCIA